MKSQTKQQFKHPSLIIDTDFADLEIENEDVGGRMPTEVHYESDSGDINDSRLRVDLLDGGR